MKTDYKYIASRNGIVASSILLAIYVSLVSLISGFDFMLSQFSEFWYFILSLAVGFGIQVVLYTYLRKAIKNNDSPGNLPAGRQVLAVSGTTSTVAMISCCTHYLVNLLPILGAVGIITVISQYQVQFFWVGLAFNFAGIVYMLNRVIKFERKI